MKRPCRRAALALLAALSLTTLGLAQRPNRESASPFAYRADVFRRLLYDLRFKPTTRFADLQKNPADTLLVILGNTDFLQTADLPDGLPGYVAQGGAALLATDRPFGNRLRMLFSNHSGIRMQVSGDIFVGPADNPNALYRGKDFCPLLVPAPAASPDLFRGRLPVATNAPSCLHNIHVLPEGLRNLAWLPAGSQAERFAPPAGLGQRQPPREPPGGWKVGLRRAGEWINGEPAEHGPLFAIGGDFGKGRILVLADHSVFINQMMLPTDNGNLEFADNALRWLQGDKEDKRRQVLFVEDGTIHDDLFVPLKDGPDLPPGVFGAVVDEALVQLEKKNTFNRVLEGWLADHALAAPGALARRVLEVLTIVLLVYAGYRLATRVRVRLDPMVPLLANELGRHTPAAPLLDQRRAAALKAGNLWETAHHLARDGLASLPLPATAGAGPPRLAVEGGWRRRLALRGCLLRLWRLAHDAAPVPVTPRALRGVLRDLAELKAAVADGSLKFP